MASSQHPLFITLPYRHERDVPAHLLGDDKYTESLVRHFLEHYTKEGYKVFDPFAGHGTTLFVAEDMKREAYGIEASRDRHEWVAAQLENWMGLRHDDAFALDRHNFPKFDFVMTSPPYMPRHHKWNPLFAGDPAHAGYARYHKRMGGIFKKVAAAMKRNARLVVSVDNLQHGQYYTPLVHDTAHTLAPYFDLKHEVIIAWDTPPHDKYQHSHCLVFKKR